MRAMSAEGIGKRCEQLMRACEREVEQLQKKAWEQLSDEMKAATLIKSMPLKSRREQEEGEKSAASRKRTEKEQEYKKVIKDNEATIADLTQKKVRASES